MGNALRNARTNAAFYDDLAQWATASNLALGELRDSLIRAIGSGSLSVSAGGVSRTFRSVAELQSALSTIDTLIRKSTRSGPRVSTIRITSSSGW